LPFAVPENVKLKLPNDWKTANFAMLYYPHFTADFATKLRNITNFVMLFQAVMGFLSRLSLDQNFTQKGKGLLFQAKSFPF
jgi:hypothetical protein